MKALLEPIKEIARFDELFRDLKKGAAGVTVISGCLESQKAHMIAGLSEDAPVRLLIAENELKAKELYEDYRLYDPETLYYPAKDLIFYQADIHGNLLIRQRLQVFQALVDQGATVIVIEHDLDVIRNADYVIDMGPGGGDAGGQIVASDTPQEIRENKNSITGRYL